MRTNDSTYRQEIRQREDRNRLFSQNLLILALGTTLFLLGGFMVTDIHTWLVFSAWLPMALLVVGVLLLSSKVYSTWTGVLLLGLSGLMWFHSYGLEHFGNLTNIIDWSFVVIGAVIILVPVVRISLKLIRSN